MEQRTRGAHLFAEHSGHRRLERLGHGHRRAEPSAGRGHLETDESRADHHHPSTLSGCGELLADGEAVVERAQREDARHPVGAGQMASPRTGRDDQSVVSELGPVLEADHPGLGVERGRAVAEAELEAEGVERIGGVVVDPLDVPETCEELLGERRPVVGRVPLVADDDHRSGVTLVADLLSRAEPGERSADHQDGAIGGERVVHGRSS